MRSIVILFLLPINLLAITPSIIPDATQNGVTVGSGWTEASARQIVRTAGDIVYIITGDDNPCNANSGQTVGLIRAWKGSGAQTGNSAVPTAFTEMDSAHHPASSGTNASCATGAGVTHMLTSPDLRLDNVGIIHVAYIDGANATVYYNTFSTVSDTWGSPETVSTGARTDSDSGWPRQVQVALALDANNKPHIAYATSGSSNSIAYRNRVSGSWSSATTIASGTNQAHPSMVTSVDGALHLAWIDSSQSSSGIKYSKCTTCSTSPNWITAESVATGVLVNGDNDQGPSIATDSGSLPYVLYLVGTVSGNDNYVRVKYRTSGGTWTDNTPPSSSGGASSSSGTWYTHTPGIYLDSGGDIFVFLGHDVNISPGVYEEQMGGVGNNWGAAVQVDPRNSTNTTAGLPGLDGSASVRFDPLRDNNTGLIDLLYYDESDGTSGYAHHATLYYKAFAITVPYTGIFTFAIN